MKSVCIIQDNKSCLRRSLDYVNIFKILDKGQVILSEKQINNADYIIIVTCAFNQVAREDGIKLIEKARSYVKDSHILVIGCLPGIVPEYFSNSMITFVRPADYDRLPNLLKNMGLLVVDSETAFDVQMNSGSTKLRQNDITLSKNSYYLNVSKGCLGECSYCEIKKAIGQLVSRPLEEIIQEVKFAIDKGAKSIYLGADDLGAWGLDIGCTLPILLKSIISVFEENEKSKHLPKKYFKIDLRNVIHPQWYIKYKDEILDLMGQHQERFPCISLAMQSGSADILSLYNRYSNVSSVLSMIQECYNVNPSLYGFDHMIAGAPFETKKDIDLTIQFMEASPIQFWTCFQYSMKDKKYENIKKSDDNWKYFLDCIYNSSFEIQVKDGRAYITKQLHPEYIFIKFD